MRLGRALAFCAFTVAAFAPRAEPASAPTAAPPRYTFSWPLGADQLRPRGGITRGAPVVLDPAPSPAWQALQATGIDAAERDRRAILAMAGTYRVSFDFIEVADVRRGPLGWRPTSRGPRRRSTSTVTSPASSAWSTSWKCAWSATTARSASRTSPSIGGRTGATSRTASSSTRAWSAGGVAPLARDEQRGAWLQTVHQVDESPRYAALGRWQHSASFSTWLSGETWRPLPRREWSVRSDYQALLGTNRHTVTATGWLQEENNLKAVLAAAGAFDARRPYVGREYGVARYERLQAGADFAAADRYYAKTRAFWNVVAGEWERRLSTAGHDHAARAGRQARPVPAALRARRSHGAGRREPARRSERDQNDPRDDAGSALRRVSSLPALSSAT